jgi:hypothetical protein
MFISLPIENTSLETAIKFLLFSVSCQSLKSGWSLSLSHELFKTIYIYHLFIYWTCVQYKNTCLKIVCNEKKRGFERYQLIVPYWVWDTGRSRLVWLLILSSSFRIFGNIFPFLPSTDKLLGYWHVNGQDAPNRFLLIIIRQYYRCNHSPPLVTAHRTRIKIPET